MTPGFETTNQRLAIDSLAATWHRDINGIWCRRSFASSISHPRMSLFKKSKKSKSHRPSQQPASLGIPAHIAAGPLGFGAMLDLNVYPEGGHHSIVIQRPAGPIQLLQQVGTMKGGLRSPFWARRARISSFMRRVLQPGLPNPRMLLRVSVFHRSCRSRCR